MRIGPKYKIARRLGDQIFEKTRTQRYALVEGKKKSNLVKRRKHRSNITEYGQQFLEKQRVRFSYGITERQLSNYIQKAKRSVKETPANEAFRLLESRLDNVVYRLSLASTRQFARQVVNHGHIIVNGKRVTVPSYQTRQGEKISIRPGSRESGIFRGKSEALKEFIPPSWLKLDSEKLEGEIVGRPKAGEYDTTMNWSALVQFYSRV